MRGGTSYAAKTLLKGLSGSIVTASSAIMEHNLRKMNIRSDIRAVKFTTESQAPSTRAEKMNLIPSVLPAPLSNNEWRRAELRWIARVEHHCPICLQRFGCAAMLCSSCSHAVHRQCFVDWQTRTRAQWCCPVCMAPANMRESPYLLEHARGAAVQVIQAGLRGYRSRRRCRALRKRNTGTLAAEVERATDALDAYITTKSVQAGVELARLQAEIDEADELFNAFMATRTVNWLAVIERTRQHQNTMCPICFEPFQATGNFVYLAADSERDDCTVSTVSCCSTLFHDNCLAIYEATTDKAVCPCCKSGFISHRVAGLT